MQPAPEYAAAMEKARRTIAPGQVNYEIRKEAYERP